jgi:hypothetical protein
MVLGHENGCKPLMNVTRSTQSALWVPGRGLTRARGAAAVAPWLGMADLVVTFRPPLAATHFSRSGYALRAVPKFTVPRETSLARQAGVPRLVKREVVQAVPPRTAGHRASGLNKPYARASCLDGALSTRPVRRVASRRVVLGQPKTIGL